MSKEIGQVSGSHFYFLYFCKLDIFLMIFCHLLIFFKIKIISRTLSECQMVWRQIRTDKTSVLIWFQTACKGYKQKTKVAFLCFCCHISRISSGCQMIWVQTVCKGYEQTTKAAASKERVNPKISIQTLKYFKL